MSALTNGSATTTTRVRTAVVGAGKMGQFHVAKLVAHPQSDFVGIFDTHPDRTQDVAAKNGVRAFDNLAELLYEADAVVVATPTEFHYQVAKEALLAGVHVLVEKPIASNSRQAAELVELADSQDLLLMSGHLERYRLRHFLEELGFGDYQGFQFIEADRLHAQGGREQDRIDVISDLMIHDLDLVLSLKKLSPSSLSAIGMPIVTRHSDISNARLEFADGAIANINASRVSTNVQRKFHIFGSNVYFSMDFLNQTATCVQRDESGRIQHRSLQVSVDCLLKQTHEFLRCVQDRSKVPLVTGREALEALVWTERIQASVAERRQLLEGGALESSIDGKERPQWPTKFS